MNLMQRFAKDVDWRPGECWPWLGIKTRLGYGRFWAPLNGRMQMTPSHRVSYRLFVGDVSSKHHVHHKCGRRECVNPEHLEAILGTEHVVKKHPESILIARDARLPALSAPTCKRGHLWSSHGKLDYRGNRVCIKCQTIASMKCIRKKKGK